jgi:hypothetical protein
VNERVGTEERRRKQETGNESFRRREARVCEIEITAAYQDPDGGGLDTFKASNINRLGIIW